MRSWKLYVQLNCAYYIINEHYIFIEEVNIHAKEKSSDETDQSKAEQNVTHIQTQEKSGDKTNQIDFEHTNKTNTLQFLHELKKERSKDVLYQS